MHTCYPDSGRTMCKTVPGSWYCGLAPKCGPTLFPFPVFVLISVPCPNLILISASSSLCSLGLWSGWENASGLSSRHCPGSDTPAFASRENPEPPHLPLPLRPLQESCRVVFVLVTPYATTWHGTHIGSCGAGARTLGGGARAGL